MSTSETTEYKVGFCPCGAGEIIKSITTQDNPWSGADISLRINCSKCSSEWRVLYNSLILLSSEQEAIRAGQNLAEIKKQLIAVIEPLFDRYFAGVKTKKAELAELHRLGISQDNYRAYLEARRKNSSIAQCCKPLSNTGWLRGIAEKSGCLDNLDALVSDLREAKEAHEHALASIVRQRIA
ncbi:hypothetical protein SAMN04487881_0062 [Marinobacter sp. es.048]|uniref:hypothetical protein n=1 Tax=Marinobacter sp. es.048 TaxID=1761795 RepID=UPI000B588023|nr:hypothetical protein [Marinobacter sp. es.048]SNC59467.1 hypothetical protein SAMN04487881_0062 [Marinobacter sp. es.048]